LDHAAVAAGQEHAMKRKDLLIPVAMLALGAGIGFWTRDRQQPQADTPPAAGDAAGALTTPAATDAAPGRTTPAESRAPARAPGSYPALSEMNAQTAPGFAAAPLPPLDARIADIYDELKQRAQRGDGKAACRLAIELQQCADRDFMLQGADRAAQMLQQDSGRRDDDNASEWEQRRRQFAQQQVDYALALDERCAGISEVQLGEHPDLWRRAALSGHVPSMVHYARGDGFRMRATLNNLDRLAQYKNEAERIMRAAAAAGSVEAAQQLSLAYADARGPWASLLQQAVKPNAVEAHSLYLLAKQRGYPPLADPGQSERWNRNSGWTDGQGYRVDAEQMAEAERRAVRYHGGWSAPDDSAGNRLSPWERQEKARAACNKDQFTKPD
jgi:hypothetical protein